MSPSTQPNPSLSSWYSSKKENLQPMLTVLQAWYILLMFCSCSCSMVVDGSTYHLARLQAISKLQYQHFIEGSGRLGRNYIGMSELVILSKKYLVTITLTVEQTFHFFLFKDLDSLLSNRPTHPPLELKVKNSSSSGNKLTLKPFQGPTFVRLFNVGQRVYLMYATKEQHFVELIFSGGNIYFDPHYLVVVNSSNIPSECHHNLNNWIPIPIPNERKGNANFLLICSIYPHRVVPLLFKKTNGARQVQVIFDDHHLEFQTVISHEQTAEYFPQLFWSYGRLECGSTPILLDSLQGQRYISFFWSTGGTMGSSSPMTYFGAYIFENNPPLRITHISADPVLIQPLLYKKEIPIPIGSKDINGSIFVMLGDGHYIRLKTNSFLQSLREVTSENLSEAYVHQHFHVRINPSYYEIQFKLLEIQKRQYKSFLIDEWQLIGTTRNPAVTYFNGSFLVVSCPPIDHIKWGLFQCLYQQYHNFLSRSYQNHFNLPLNVSTENNDHLALSAEDIRLIVINETRLYGVFTNHRPGTYHFDTFVSELYFRDSHLYAKEPTMMNVSYESSMVSQKNWIPFVCPNVSMTGLCFVQRIIPHTIVSDMTVVAQSSYDRQNTIWIYGEPRGGSQAELVDTPYGKRYFALFHSSQERGGDKRGRGIKTYYAGGYLFRSEYPYDITHMSTEPLAPASFYNISQTWGHRGMDFVVFPMSLLIRGEIAYVSFGVQDRAGYMIKLQLRSFFLTLQNVTTQPRNMMNVKFTM